MGPGVEVRNGITTAGTTEFVTGRRQPTYLGCCSELMAVSRFGNGSLAFAVHRLGAQLAPCGRTVCEEACGVSSLALTIRTAGPSPPYVWRGVRGVTCYEHIPQRYEYASCM